MNINFAICDDLQVDIDFLCSLLPKWAKKNKCQIKVSTCHSAEEFLFKYENTNSFDIILLDVQMKNINGIDLAKQIRKNNTTTQIIFITGYEEFISFGYDVNALHYLLKPVKQDKLEEVLDKAKFLLTKSEASILIKEEKYLTKITLSNIIYIESNAHIITIKMTHSTIQTNSSLLSIFDKLDERFIKCHRSFIVNIEYINQITITDLILDNKNTIPLSRRSRDAVTKKFIAHNRKNLS